MFGNLSNVADKYHLDDSVVDNIYQRSWKTPANYDACLQPATFVGHQTKRNIKSCIDSMSDEKDLHCWPFLQSGNEKFPDLLPRGMARQSYVVSLLYFKFCNIEQLNEILVGKFHKTSYSLR